MLLQETMDPKEATTDDPPDQGDTGSGGGSEDHSEESGPDSPTVDITDPPADDDSASTD